MSLSRFLLGQACIFAPDARTGELLGPRGTLHHVAIATELALKAWLAHKNATDEWLADHIGHARQMAMSPAGTLYVNTWSGRYYQNDKPHDGGFLVALKDTKDDGVADKIERFGSTAAEGNHGGTGIALYDGKLYAETNDKIVRYDLTKGGLAPQGKPTTIVEVEPVLGRLREQEITKARTLGQHLPKVFLLLRVALAVAERK